MADYPVDAWEDTTPESGYEITVLDNGDGKQAGYVYDIGTTAWVFRYDVDIQGNKSLDDAYNDGREITVDEGPVTLSQTSAYAPQVQNQKHS